MEIKDIVNYVTNTPHNSNKQVLKSMLEKLTEGGGGSEYDIDSLINGSITKIESKVNTIKSSAFDGCINLKEAIFPNATEIDDSAFWDCHALIKLEIPKVKILNTQSIGDCIVLKALDCPEVEIVGSSCFENCEKLESINLPKVKKIESGAFASCRALKTIHIPTTVQEIDEDGFGWTGLTDIYIDKAEGEIPGAPWGAKNATIHYNS